MRALLLTLALACAACKTSSSAERQAKVDDTIKSTDNVVDTETIKTGPETIETKTDEYAPLPPAPPPVPGQPAAPRLRHGPLVKHTDIIDHKAPAEDYRWIEGQMERGHVTVTTTDTKTAKASAPSGFWAALGGLWPWLLAGVLVLAGIIAWRVLRARVGV